MSGLSVVDEMAAALQRRRSGIAPTSKAKPKNTDNDMSSLPGSKALQDNKMMSNISSLISKAVPNVTEQEEKEWSDKGGDDSD